MLRPAPEFAVHRLTAKLQDSSGLARRGLFVERAQWKTPEDVKKAHPKASILESGRVVFNIKSNDYRLIALVEYENGLVDDPIPRIAQGVRQG